ncbi:hypothetical protein D3C75_754870 [compost metagenome]
MGLQRKAHGRRQFQVQATPQQRFGPGVDQVTEHQHGVPRQQPVVGRGRGMPAERHHFTPLDHLQLHPRVILQEQRIEAAFMAFERGTVSHGQAHHQHPQLEGYRRTQGDTQLCGTQHGQQPGAAAIVALQHQQAAGADVFGPACSNQQPLYQQLQGSTLRL